MTPAQRLRKLAGDLDTTLLQKRVREVAVELRALADEVDEEKQAIAEEQLHNDVVNSIDPYGQEGF